VNLAGFLPVGTLKHALNAPPEPLMRKMQVRVFHAPMDIQQILPEVPPAANAQHSIIPTNWGQNA
jgi:hypothetical protein